MAAKKSQKSREDPVSTRPGKNGGTLNTGGTFDGSGRPKGSRNIKTILTKVLNSTPPEQWKELARKRGIDPETNYDVMVAALLADVVENADSPNAKLILSYSDGLPLQRVQHLGDSDQPVYTYELNADSRKTARAKLDAIRESTDTPD